VTERRTKKAGEPVTRAFETRGLSINIAERSVEVVASTDVIDAHGESIEQTSWILDRYRRNPIVALSHNLSALPVGTAAVRIGKVDGRPALLATITFASAAANPVAEQCLRLFNEGALNAVSVGFCPHSIRTETREGRSVDVLADCELFEISCVAVPSNPQTLAKSKAAPQAVEPAHDSWDLTRAIDARRDENLAGHVRSLFD
jgi:HK97 family phage prohead protease